ncbi:MAG: hypothetical protein EAX90_10200 [Candidatus Heimdallarchaeota archaeon]|nr:hypothetical protein [Candidatus Heimdallarchaeota archaeon]
MYKSYSLKVHLPVLIAVNKMEIVLKGNSEGAAYAVSNKALAIIVDTLRASTTIPIMMLRGIKEIFVTKEVSDARLAANELNMLLIGERGCLKLEGFDFGNSPTEMNAIQSFTKSSVSFTSSTGARIIVESIGSECIIVGSPINAKSVVEAILDFKQIGKLKSNKIIIIPAFTEGPINKSKITEDQIGGLIIANEFLKKGISLSKELEEEINFLNDLLEKNTLNELLLQTDHGKKLVDLELSKDVEFCSGINQINTVPISWNNIHKLTNNINSVLFTKV